MATNPMQRKARNSFLLGMLVMLVISGIVIAFLVMQLMSKIQEERQNATSMVNAYVLTQDVKSGQVITNDMLQLTQVNRNLVPSNATSDLSVIENYALQDKEGNQITTQYDNQGNATMYITVDNTRYQVQQDETTGNYYIERNGQAEYLELDSVPIIAKVNMNANTLITTDLISRGDSVVQDDVRRQEYNVVVLPIDLATGDYIDIRLMLPNGQDFIVVSKKEVEIPNLGDEDSQDTIWVNLSEDEILHMSCAIIDAFRVNGAKLYATKYTEPGMQNAATPTYVVNSDTSALLQSDPNILNTAMQAIRDRYNSGNSATIRNDYINNVISSQGDQANTNLQTNMEDSITRSQDARKDYLDSLAGGTTTTTTTTSTQ